MRHKIRQLLSIFITGALLFFLISPFVQTHTYLKESTFHIQLQWLCSSFGVLLFHRIVYIHPFATLLHGITEKQVSFQTAFTLFYLSNITRYLPGRVWGVVRMLSLSHRFGLSKTATANSFTLHVGIETVIGGILALSLFFSKQMQGTIQDVLKKISGHTMLWPLAVGGITISTLFLIPTLSTYTRQVVKTFQGMGRFFFEKPFWKRQWLHIIANHLLLWMCQGLAFSLFVRSFVPVRWAHTGIIVACYAFAWIVGFLSFLTPGGLGVRESLLALLLTSYMPTSQATLVALLCRLWMLSAEIVLAGIAFSLRRRTLCLS